MPVGSSAKTTLGLVTSARAIATRCCWPPESSEGRWRAPVCQADVGEQLVDPCPLGLVARELEREDDVLLRGQHRQEVEELEHEADVTAAELRQLAVAELRDRGAVDPDLTRARPVESGQDVHERRFARSRGTHHGDELALVHRE